MRTVLSRVSLSVRWILHRRKQNPSITTTRIEHKFTFLLMQNPVAEVNLFTSSPYRKTHFLDYERSLHCLSCCWQTESIEELADEFKVSQLEIYESDKSGSSQDSAMLAAAVFFFRTCMHTAGINAFRHYLTSWSGRTTWGHRLHFKKAQRWIQIYLAMAPWIQNRPLLWYCEFLCFPVLQVFCVSEVAGSGEGCFYFSHRFSILLDKFWPRNTSCLQQVGLPCVPKHFKSRFETGFFLTLAKLA